MLKSFCLNKFSIGIYYDILFKIWEISIVWVILQCSKHEGKQQTDLFLKLVNEMYRPQTLEVLSIYKWWNPSSI